MPKSRSPDFRRIQDNEGDYIRVTGNGSIFADDGEHARTAFDERYFYSHEWTSVGAGSTVTMTIYTGTKFPHGIFVINSDNEISYNFELCNSSASEINGTQDYQFNINRGKNNKNSVASFYYGDTNVSSTGSLWKTLEEGKTIAGKFSEPDTKSTVDWLLDSGRVYNLKITNEGADAGWINLHYIYHEHDAVTGLLSEVAGNGEGEQEYSSGGHL